MFLSDLELIAQPGRPDQWWTGAPLIWDEGICVPEGFRTDLATIPHILELFPDLDINGRSRRPGVLHDWLYGGARWIGKAAADATLYRALLAEGMPEHGARTIYEAVHWFADAAWRDDGSESVAGMFRTPDHYQAWLATHPQLNPVG